MSFASEFVARVTAHPQWGDDDFRVVDVGASGGIAQRWNVFGDRLWAVGFDPLVAEIRRLAGLERRPKVHYEAAFVGWPHFDRVFPPEERLDLIKTRHVQPFSRVSAVSAQRLMKQEYVREVFNAGAPIEYTDRHITLDDYFRGQTPPDFLKIDTDGGDFLVLMGAERLIGDSVLGIQLEAMFHGAVHEYANTFDNVDRYLRQRGFSLFELTPYRYSRADLPAPFVYDIPAQTTMGQVSWAEALYLRDLAHPSYDETFGYRSTPERVLRVCCLHALNDLNDCAAELLLRHPALRDLADRQLLLDALTPRLFGRLSYQEYMSRFEADPTSFYPTRLRAGAAWLTSGSAPVVVPQGARLVPGAVHVTSVRAHGSWSSRVEVGQRAVTLTTSPVPWAYSAEIDLDRSRIGADRPLYLSVELVVTRGEIGIGCLLDDATTIDGEVVCPAREGAQTVVIALPRLADLKYVLVRNMASSEPAVARFVKIDLYEAAAPGVTVAP